MGLLTITVSESLPMISPETTNKWGTFVWGTDKWGGRDIPYLFDKYLQEFITVGDIVSKIFTHYLQDSFSLSDQITYLILANNGWYQTKDGKSNAIYWPIDSFGETIAASDNWIDVTPTTTTWVSI